MSTMPSRYRPPGPLGCGGAPLGNLFDAVTDDEADAVLAAAWDEGVRHFDTAPSYGFGLSEHRMGRALRTRPRDAFAIATKVGRLLEPIRTGPVARERSSFVDGLPFSVRFDYGADATFRAIEDSLQRLGLSRVDIVYIHDVSEDTHGADWVERFDTAMRGAAVALTRLRDEGVIRAWGLGVNRVEPCMQALDRADPDLFLCAGRYTLLDTASLDTLLPACAARGIGLVVGGPYNSGLLAGHGTYDYAAAPADLVARRDAMALVCRAHGVDLRAAALQFCAAHPVTASVIPGARSVDEMRTNAALMRAPVPGAFWAEMKRAGLIPTEAPTPG